MATRKCNLCGKVVPQDNYVDHLRQCQWFQQVSSDEEEDYGQYQQGDNPYGPDAYPKANRNQQYEDDDEEEEEERPKRKNKPKAKPSSSSQPTANVYVDGYTRKEVEPYPVSQGRQSKQRRKQEIALSKERWRRLNSKPQSVVEYNTKWKEFDEDFLEVLPQYCPFCKFAFPSETVAEHIQICAQFHPEPGVEELLDKYEAIEQHIANPPKNGEYTAKELEKLRRRALLTDGNIISNHDQDADKKPTHGLLYSEAPSNRSTSQLASSSNSVQSMIPVLQAVAQFVDTVRQKPINNTVTSNENRERDLEIVRLENEMRETRQLLEKERHRKVEKQKAPENVPTVQSTSINIPTRSDRSLSPLNRWATESRQQRSRSSDAVPPCVLKWRKIREEREKFRQQEHELYLLQKHKDKRSSSRRSRSQPNSSFFEDSPYTDGETYYSDEERPRERRKEPRPEPSYEISESRVISSSSARSSPIPPSQPSTRPHSPIGRFSQRKIPLNPQPYTPSPAPSPPNRRYYDHNTSSADISQVRPYSEYRVASNPSYSYTLSESYLPSTTYTSTPSQIHYPTYPTTSYYHPTPITSVYPASSSSVPYYPTHSYSRSYYP